MTETIAIDFGTSRTKLAYLGARGEAKVMRFEEERAWAPSLFYLAPQSDEVLWGYDAAAMLEDDPGGIVDTLKRKLQTTKVRANGRGVEPQRLLTHMFTALRRQAGTSVLDFGGTAPEAVKLTVPVLYGPPIEKVMRDAATVAGFRDAELITEPVAAARAWASEVGSDAQDVIVFDAGGGTIDWAWLRREDGVVPECPPGGDKDVGGHHLDEGLLELLKDALDREGAVEALEQVERERVRWLAKVRSLKEQFSRGVAPAPLRVRSHTVTLSPAAIEEEIKTRFIAQSCDWLASYLEKVRALAPKAQPTVLLVGGSARLKGLSAAIEARLDCPVCWWERSEYATVLGALSSLLRAEPIEQPADSKGNALQQYRAALEMAWIDRRIDADEVAHLAALADRLGLSARAVARLEREVFGDTKESLVALAKAVEVILENKPDHQVKQLIDKISINRVLLANHLVEEVASCRNGKMNAYYSGDGAPKEKLTAAKTTFLKGVRKSNIYLYYDDTFWGGGKDGFAITSSGVHWRSTGGDVHFRRMSSGVFANASADGNKIKLDDNMEISVIYGDDHMRRTLAFLLRLLH